METIFYQGSSVIIKYGAILINMQGNKICNKIIIFSKARKPEKILINEEIGKVKNTPQFSRVINSLKLPNRKLVNLYWEFFGKQEIGYLNTVFRKYYLQLKKIYDKDNTTTFIAVARSGVPLLEIIRYLFKQDGVNIKFSVFSPNYFSLDNVGKLNKHISKLSKTLVFVDGWSSSGLTYRIIKGICKKHFLQKKFYYSVITNNSEIKNKDIISVSRSDILLPWSFFQTDHSGYSNFFSIKNTCVCFFVPVANRIKVLIPKDYFKLFSNQKITRDLPEKQIHKEKSCGINFKHGINEVVKSIDKGDAVSIIIPAKSRYMNILRNYADNNKVPVIVKNNIPYCVCNRKEIKR